jgi:hypothetical protein
MRNFDIKQKKKYYKDKMLLDAMTIESQQWP